MADKKQNAATAAAHTLEMSRKYKHQIKLSVEHSRIYDGSDICSDWKPVRKYETEIIFKGTDTVSALADIYDEKVINNTGLLNFASYKHPGGMFLAGATTQEEALCHESFLYNVIKEKPEYYNYNKKHLNRTLYTDRALFTPDIIFRNKYECSVLTCAAPNYSAAHRFKGVTKTENYKVMKERVRFMLSCFACSNCNIIILGAWGCGVFGQYPAEVAEIYKDLFNNEFEGVFEKVIIAVPEKGKNYEVFKQYFEKE